MDVPYPVVIQSPIHGFIVVLLLPGIEEVDSTRVFRGLREQELGKLFRRFHLFGGAPPRGNGDSGRMPAPDRLAGHFCVHSMRQHRRGVQDCEEDVPQDDSPVCPCPSRFLRRKRPIDVHAAPLVYRKQHRD